MPSDAVCSLCSTSSLVDRLLHCRRLWMRRQHGRITCRQPHARTFDGVWQPAQQHVQTHDHGMLRASPPQFQALQQSAVHGWREGALYLLNPCLRLAHSPPHLPLRALYSTHTPCPRPCPAGHSGPPPRPRPSSCSPRPTRGTTPARVRATTHRYRSEHCRRRIPRRHHPSARPPRLNSNPSPSRSTTPAGPTHPPQSLLSRSPRPVPPPRNRPPSVSASPSGASTRRARATRTVQSRASSGRASSGCRARRRRSCAERAGVAPWVGGWHFGSARLDCGFWRCGVWMDGFLAAARANIDNNNNITTNNHNNHGGRGRFGRRAGAVHQRPDGGAEPRRPRRRCEWPARRMKDRANYIFHFADHTRTTRSR